MLRGDSSRLFVDYILDCTKANISIRGELDVATCCCELL